MELERNFMVLEIMDSEVQDKIKLVSAIYGLSLEELMVKAVASYKGQYDSMTCPHCKIVIPKKPYAFTKELQVGGKTYEITIRNFPFFKCNSCNQEFHDVRTNLYVERLLERYIQQSLLEGQVVKEKVLFESLIDLNK